MTRFRCRLSVLCSHISVSFIKKNSNSNATDDETCSLLARHDAGYAGCGLKFKIRATMTRMFDT